MSVKNYVYICFMFIFSQQVMAWGLKDIDICKEHWHKYNGIQCVHGEISAFHEDGSVDDAKEKAKGECAKEKQKTLIIYSICNNSRTLYNDATSKGDWNVDWTKYIMYKCASYFICVPDDE